MRLISNSQGSSLVLVLLFFAIAGVLLGAMQRSFLGALEQDRYTRALMGIERTQAQLKTLLGQDDVWKSTVSNAAYNNDLRTCLTNTNGVCFSILFGLQPLTLVDGSGEIQFGRTDQDWGFNADGEVCQSFNPLQGSNSCPFSYDIKWQPSCDPSITCVNPRVHIVAELRISASHSGLLGVINPNKYKIVMVR